MPLFTGKVEDAGSLVTAAAVFNEPSPTRRVFGGKTQGAPMGIVPAGSKTVTNALVWLELIFGGKGFVLQVKVPLEEGTPRASITPLLKYTGHPLATLLLLFNWLKPELIAEQTSVDPGLNSLASM